MSAMLKDLWNINRILEKVKEMENIVVFGNIEDKERKSVVCHAHNNWLHSSVYSSVLSCMSQNIGVRCKNVCN